MKWKYLIWIAFIIILIYIGALIYFNFWRITCNEKKIILEGKAEILRDKYPINIIKSNNIDYWIYDFAPEINCPTCGVSLHFDDVINRSIEIEGILSPALQKGIRPICNVCYRDCPSCQCPEKALLYNVKILKVLE